MKRRASPTTTITTTTQEDQQHEDQRNKRSRLSYETDQSYFNHMTTTTRLETHWNRILSLILRNNENDNSSLPSTVDISNSMTWIMNHLPDALDSPSQQQQQQQHVDQNQLISLVQHALSQYMNNSSNNSSSNTNNNANSSNNINNSSSSSSSSNERALQSLFSNELLIQKIISFVCHVVMHYQSSPISSPISSPSSNNNIYVQLIQCLSSHITLLYHNNGNNNNSTTSGNSNNSSSSSHGMMMMTSDENSSDHFILSCILNQLILLFNKLNQTIVSTTTTTTTTATTAQSIDDHKQDNNNNHRISLMMNSSGVVNQLLNMICHSSLLNDWNHSIRKTCIQLLCQIQLYLNTVVSNHTDKTATTTTATTATTTTNIVNMMKKFVYDRDARVRCTSFHCIRTLYQSMSDSCCLSSFDIQLYQMAVNGLQDDIQQVREEAMELMFLLSTLFPSFSLSSSSNSDASSAVVDSTTTTTTTGTTTVTHSGTTLLEDAFKKTCTMVRDTVVSVRTRACALLGQFAQHIEKLSHHVHFESLLLETFSKMNMNYHQPAKQLSAAKYDTISNHDTASSKSSSSTNTGSIGSSSAGAGAGGGTSGGDPSIEDLADGDIVIALDDEESNELLHTGVVGTFVLALEDQYQSVRIAAIRSIQQLSAIRYVVSSSSSEDNESSSGDNTSISSDSLVQLRNTSYTFSRTALGHLINIFSDDIDQVRQSAIDAVTRLGTPHEDSSNNGSGSSSCSLVMREQEPNQMLRFNEEQLQVILILLEDLNGNIRSSVHSLLSVVHLSNSSCVHAAIKALLTSNMSKYPGDLPNIFQTLKHLGLNHHTIVELLIEELLKLERYYMLPEQMVDDLYYTGILIVIMNAVSLNPNILNHLPPHVYTRHYEYMKSKWNQPSNRNQQDQQQLFPQLHITSIQQRDDSHDHNLQRPSTISYSFKQRTVSLPQQQQNNAPAQQPNGISEQQQEENELSLSQYLSQQAQQQVSITDDHLRTSENVLSLSSQPTTSLLSILQSNLSFIQDQYQQQSQWSHCYESVRLLHRQLSSSGMSDSNVHYYQLYVQCLHIYMRMMNEWNPHLTCHGDNSSENREAVNHGTRSADNQLLKRMQSYVNTMIYLSYKMNTLFSQQSDDHKWMKIFRFMLHYMSHCAACTLSTTSSSAQEEERSAHASMPYSAIQSLRNRARHLQSQLNLSDHESSMIPERLRKLIHRLLNDTSLQLSSSTLDVDYELITSYFPTLSLLHTNGTRVMKRMRRLRCRITHPETNTDKPFAFLSYVPLNLTVRGVLYNYDPSAHNLFIAVRFPNNSFSVFPIHRSDVLLNTNHSHMVEFRSELSLNIESWTHASSLHIGVMCQYTTDSTSSDAQGEPGDEYVRAPVSTTASLDPSLHATTTTNNMWYMESGSSSPFVDLRSQFMTISHKPVEYSIHPQEN